MTIAAFVGPSLPAADRARFDGIHWLPPAEAGDLLRLDHGAYSAICLIDGFFDHRPAVRHKEILLLLSRGARIYGASSIGALRAAEMDAFGMIGVGAIYNAYARGTIVADDEVALIHRAEEADMRPLSLPLVDVRATLCRARRMHALGKAEARAMLRAAAAVHYIDRTWEAVLTVLPGPAGAEFKAWLKTGEVAQKVIDARLCIRRAIADMAAPGSPPELVRTAFLDELARECSAAL